MPIQEAPTEKLWNIPLVNDTSALFILLSNLFTLILALVQAWHVATVLFIYVIQSIIIGFFTYIKILLYKPGPEGHISSKGKVIIMPSFVGKIVNFFLATFFAMHYGGFQIAYLFFLTALGFMTKMPASDIPVILLAGLGFFIAHLVSFIQHRKEHYSLMRTMFFPYLRIIPMHATIIVGAGFLLLSPNASPFVLTFFMALKTIADLILHKKEHQALIL
jgi:hypothetical protein